MPTFSQPPNNVPDSISSRLTINYLLDTQALEKEDTQDVVSGLSNNLKSIPARYFYDAQGSELFEQICQLPEYYPTRTEASILQQYAQDIANQAQVSELIELGSGSATKTRYLLDAYQSSNSFFYYHPVDVSGSILKASANDLLAEYPQLKIQGMVATYNQALQQLKSQSLEQKIIIFLGSSIGNFQSSECDRFITQVTIALNPGDYFLLGIDLQKPIDVLEAAYNDSQGVTAAFNLNILQHLNHRFTGNFDLNLFRHQAVYNSIEHQIEMYLISQRDQSVTFKDLDLTIKLDEGEKILTEISRKFNLKQIEQSLDNHQLDLIKTYTDKHQWFGLLLLRFR